MNKKKVIQDRIRYAIRPDAQAFDEIKISIVPRYKESEASGDEWRISTKMEFWRKGKLIHTDSVGGRMDVACALVSSKYLEAIELHMKGYFAGDGKSCDQEGCQNPAKFLYRIKEEFCVGGGNCGAKKESYGDMHRCFCNEHKTRGNSDLEDNDDNYELINGL